MPPPGITPTRAWVSAKRARSDAMRKSQHSASSRPPVTVGPLMAPMIGVSCGGIIPTCRAGFALTLLLHRSELGGQRLEVHAGAERRVGSGEHHAADVVAPVEAGDGVVELTVQLGRNGVTRLGAVQGDRGHPFVDLDLHEHQRPLPMSAPFMIGHRHGGHQSLGAPSAQAHPLLVKEGEAVGVALLALDPLPAPQRRLPPEADRPGRSGPTRCSRAPRRGAVAGWPALRTRTPTTARKACAANPRPRAGDDPVPDGGTAALDLLEPQPDRPDARRRSRRPLRSRRSTRHPGPPDRAGAR